MSDLDKGEKIATLTVSHKDPDLLYGLDLTEEQLRAVNERYFEFGEYFSVELDVDAEFNVLAARFVEQS